MEAHLYVAARETRVFPVTLREGEEIPPDFAHPNRATILSEYQVAQILGAGEVSLSLTDFWERLDRTRDFGPEFGEGLNSRALQYYASYR